MCCHIRSRNLYIAVARDVDSLRIVVFIVFAGRDREGGYRTLAMVHDGMDVRGEYRVCIVIHRYRRIGPPEKGLGRICPVEQAALDLDISLAGTKRK